MYVHSIPLIVLYMYSNRSQHINLSVHWNIMGDVLIVLRVHIYISKFIKKMLQITMKSKRNLYTAINSTLNKKKCLVIKDLNAFKVFRTIIQKR